MPAQQIADIQVDLDVEPLECGFKSFAQYMYLRKNRSDIITIGARPGVGKSAMAMQIAMGVAQHSPVLAFSIEMSKDQLKGRLLTMATGRSAAQLKHPSNRDLIALANERFRTQQMYIDDQNSITIDLLCSRAHTFARKRGLALVVVDYLQIVNTKSGRSKAEEIAFVMERLKGLAKDLNIPILLLAQMNRQFDMRLSEDPEARPVMSDLADGSAIEKWSDVVMCMHKPYDHTVNIYLLKNRHGVQKDLSFGFSGELTKFIDHGDAGL